MEPIFAVIAIAILANFNVAMADCRVLEYAEIKETSTKELVNTYCYYKDLAGNQSTYIQNIQQTQLDAIRKGLSDWDMKKLKFDEEIKAAEANRTTCYDQLSKISGALERRKKQEPKCEGN